MMLVLASTMATGDRAHQFRIPLFVETMTRLPQLASTHEVALGEHSSNVSIPQIGFCQSTGFWLSST